MPSHARHQTYLLGTVAAGALVAAALHAAPAAAQQAAPAAPGTAAPAKIEEVVVTAQKRSEKLQRVPIAVTAFTAAEIKRKSITEVSDLGRLTPNTNLDTASPFGGSNEVLSASIRGIGQDDFGINLDPGVGVYVDGVYYARTVGANLGLPDVSRVEILKGPQGTLFGRNTIGGAISVVTATPGDVYKADLQATVGSYNRRDFQGTVDVPLVPDRVLGSLTFSTENRDGYQKRIPYTVPGGYSADAAGAFRNNGTETFDTQGGQGQDTLRGKLRFILSDQLSDTISADWTHGDTSSTPESLLAVAPTSFPAGLGAGSVFGTFYNLCIAGRAPIPTLALACGPRGPGISAAGTTNGNPGLFGATTRLPFGPQYITGNPDLSYGTGPDFDNMTNYGVANTLDWVLSPAADLRSITSYREMNWRVGVDPDASPVEMNLGSFTIHQHQVSQEFQLTGAVLDDKLKYSAGLFYFNEGGFEQDYVQLGAGLLQIDGRSTIDTTSAAGYAHVDYNVIGDLTLIAGARYSYDHKSVVFDQFDDNLFDYKITGCYPLTAASVSCVNQRGGYDYNPAHPLLYAPTGPYTQDFYVFTPTAGLNYQLTPDIMAYGTYSKGFKDGGWSTRITQPEPELPSFGPEKAQTFEVGVKSQFLDHRLQLDLAGFYTNYKGIQLNFQEGVSPTIRNAGNAVIEGGELEGRVLVTDGLSVAANAGYMNAYYTSLAAGINGDNSCVQPYQACITLGSKLPKTPKWKVSLSPTYLLPLPNGQAIRFGADYVYTASVYNDSVNTSLLRRPQTSILNATVTYMSPHDRYELTVGGTNITDERYLVTGNQDTADSIIYGTYDAPAEWYVTARARF
jgi:iron complex outermembrane receptor protein